VIVPAPERPNPDHPSLNPLDKAKDVATGVAHPVETTKELAAEAERGRSARTPLIAVTGVTIVVGIAFAILLAIALVLYFVYGGK
jgi:cell division protein FtsX